MDQREKREDETWAEYGARMASMGIAPTKSYFAGPTVNQFRPTGSDYTPQQLNTPIQQLQQQNIPQNVVPITPVDPTLAGMSAIPLAAGIRRPGRRVPRTLTPEQVAVRDANRLKVENQQLARNIARSDAAYAREVPTKGV